MTAPIRFRFGSFVLSPRQRLLLRDGQAVPLIPKYFDLLRLLVVRRGEAVRKQDIFAEVWSDVVVSDGALSQAIRTLRRTLDDDSREPRFIRTVSRHGYQFVWRDVIEEPDLAVDVTAPVPAEGGQPMTPLVDQLLAAADAEVARDLAERLHALGTADAVSSVTARPHHAPAMAMLRETRWAVPNAGDVPILTDPEAATTILALVRLRIDDARRELARRWAGAAAMGALGGALAGLAGGLILIVAPGSNAHLEGAVALAAMGALAGALGAGGIASGLAIAEVLARSHRALALIACGAVAGALIGGASALVVRALLAALVGMHLAAPNGLVEGMVLGAAAGLGYALAGGPEGGGMVAPRGAARVRLVALVALTSSIAALALAAAGLPLVGGLVHEIARSSRDAELGLAPLGRLIGEPDFGARTQLVLSALEGAVLGGALAFGLTRRPAIR